MSLNNENPKVTPAIRAVGYTDGWNFEQLGTLLKFSNGVNAPKDAYGAGIPMASVMDVLKDGPMTYGSIKGSVDPTYAEKESSQMTRGDLLFVRSSETPQEAAWAKAYSSDQSATFSGFTIRGKQLVNYSPLFLESFLNGHGRKQLDTFASGSTHFNISQDWLGRTVVPYPAVEEQQAVSGIVEGLTKQIKFHAKRIAPLKKARHWAEQNLLPEPNETAPKVRVGEFDGEWIESKLGDFLHSTTAKSTIENEYPVLSSTTKHVELRSGRVGGESNIGYRVLNSGQLVLSPQNAWMGNINISHVSIGMVSPSYLIYDVIGIDSNYLEAVIKLPSFAFQIGQVSEAGASVVRRNLNKSEFLRIKMCVPPLEEQQAIAKVFTTIDARIKSEQQLIADLQEVKRWALDNMFV